MDGRYGILLQCGRERMGVLILIVMSVAKIACFQFYMTYDDGLNNRYDMT